MNCRSVSPVGAAHEIGRINRILGPDRAKLVRLVLIEKLDLREAAFAMGLLGTSREADEQTLERLQRQLRQSLDVIAREFALNDRAPRTLQ